MTLTSCVIKKGVSHPASAADAATNLRMVHRVWMAPLSWIH